MENWSGPTATGAMEWQPVDSRYRTLLRLYLLPPLCLALLTSAGTFGLARPLLGWFAAAVALGLAAAMLFWVPRRFRYTCYRLLPSSMNMRTGLWWQTQTSVSINRIQHLEITQGPLERGLNIAKLVIYTAGGMRSDLRLPGLNVATAEHLKQELLEKIASEREAPADD